MKKIKSIKLGLKKLFGSYSDSFDTQGERMARFYYHRLNN